MKIKPILLSKKIQMEKKHMKRCWASSRGARVNKNEITFYLSCFSIAVKRHDDTDNL